ncbi:MAG: trigger factor [Parachlamydiaceae bacterium]
MDNSPSTFKNDSVAVTVTHKPGSRVVLEVTITPEAVQAGYKKAIAVVRKEVSIPGFRKGKAPESVIVANYPKPIDKEWKDIVMNTALQEAVQLTKLAPFNKTVNSADLKSFSKETGAVLHYEYEIFPRVPSIVPENLSIPKVDLRTINDDAVNTLLENLQLQNAAWTVITDRPAQEGDFIVVNIDDISGTPRNICQGALLRFTKDRMDPWIYNLVLGLDSGNAVEGMSEGPKHDEDCSGCADGSHGKNDEFIPTLCRITLQEIRQATPHALDDELAKKHGATDCEDLKEKARKALESQATNEQKEKQRSLMEKAILETYPFEIPISLIDAELANMEASIKQKLQSERVPASVINAETKKIKDQLRHRYAHDYILYFLIQKAVQEHQVAITKEEIMMELMRQMLLEQQEGMTKDSVKDLKERENQVALQLLTMKVLDFLIAKSA